MNVYEAMTAARDAMTVRRVFGEPYERDGVTLIPAALVAGGLGAGSGRVRRGKDEDRPGHGGTAGKVSGHGQGSGSGVEPGGPDRGSGGDRRGDGGGFGMAAVPVGAYSIRAGRVRWHPAINADLLVLATAAVTVTWLAGRALTPRHRR